MKSIIILLFLLPIYSQGQNHAYFKFIKEADSLFKIKEFKKSALAFSAAFSANGDMGLVQDRYNAARAWSRSGVADSAFYQLNRIAAKGNFDDYDLIVSDSTFSVLYRDQRWASLLKTVNSNRLKTEKLVNKSLALELDSIFADDQDYRKLITRTEKEFGIESEQYKNLISQIKSKDSINLIKVKKILDTEGWPGMDVIGEKGSLTLFLVIQHADPATQRRYLPILKEAVRTGKAKSYYLAYLEDRVALSEGKKQIYGTQIYKTENGYKIAPIEDERNVDVRRKMIGLSPLAEYVKEWNIEYHLQDL